MKRYFKTRNEWRTWLKNNHSKYKKLTLIKYKKHTGKPSLGMYEAMHEAICFGWIDTTTRRLDDKRFAVDFARRSKHSKWSKNTRRYARMLIKEGKMHESGLKAFKEGLKKPTHDHGIPKNPETPEELKNTNFEKRSPTFKRTQLRWLLRAKRPETRKKRIKAILKL